MLLAALRAVKEHPGRKAENLEPVLHAGRRKKKISRAKRLTSAIADEDSSAGDDDVGFIARVRFLRIAIDRRRKELAR